MSPTTATLQITVPVLETEHLILREPRLSDWEAMNAFGRSERAAYIGGPYEDWQNWEALNRGIGHWFLRGYGMWSVEEKATGRLAGRVGIINHHDWPEPELGWHVYEGFEGKGLAYEAAIAARSHAQGPMGLAPLISQIDPGNARSRKLAERMGAALERESVLRGQRCLVYRHPKGAA